MEILRADLVLVGMVVIGVLDESTRRFLQQQLLRLWQEHKKTIVFVTHSVQGAVYLSDRIVVMTARPGCIRTIIVVSLHHPREFRSDEFREQERRVFDQLDEELTKSLSLEAQDLSDARNCARCADRPGRHGGGRCHAGRDV